MSRLEVSQPLHADAEKPLLDLPLRSIETTDSSFPVAGSAPDALAAEVSAAKLTRRAGACAADAAIVLLIWAAAMLIAQSVHGIAPSAAALAWSAAFLLMLSFFATVPALILFGRTVGMALAGLAARPTASGRRLSSEEALRRWLGTIATAATLGVALLFTARSCEAPTPADRLSRRPLEDDGPRA